MSVDHGQMAVHRRLSRLLSELGALSASVRTAPSGVTEVVQELAFASFVLNDCCGSIHEATRALEEQPEIEELRLLVRQLSGALGGEPLLDRLGALSDDLARFDPELTLPIRLVRLAASMLRESARLGVAVGNGYAAALGFGGWDGERLSAVVEEPAVTALEVRVYLGQVIAVLAAAQEPTLLRVPPTPIAVLGDDDDIEF